LNTEILTQPTLNNGEHFVLGDEIIKLLSSKKPKFKTASFMFSLIKANAIDTLKNHLKTFIDNGGSINFYIDSDKRFLANPLISELIALGCNVYTYMNENKSIEFQYRGVIFESSKTAEIFFTSGNMSLNGLFEAHNIITHISATKEEYKNLETIIFNKDLTNNFVKITLENLPSIIGELKKASSIPTISDFTKNDLKISPEIDLSEPNIAIEINDDVNFLMTEETPIQPKKVIKEEISETIENVNNENKANLIVEYSSEPIYYGVDDAIDVENLLFESKSKPTMSFSSKPIKTNAFSSDHFIADDEENEKENNEEKIYTTAKTKDLSKTSIFMFEAPKITHKGVCAGEIKVPTYIRDLISEFWGWPETYEVVGGQAKIKSKVCTFKIIDTMQPENTLEDEKAKLFQRVDESSFTIYSSVLESLNIEENDIIRLIKVSTDQDYYYTCEVIRKDAKEYPIWEQFCTQNFKSSSRKYGIM